MEEATKDSNLLLFVHESNHNCLKIKKLFPEYCISCEQWFFFRFPFYLFNVKVCIQREKPYSCHF
ncbi:hypothetical protein T4D_5681 [Trichinella pseudospiralis]|uniref:Uncharacterized protein n=1 Tax=Trichinella pseudospiralis TaxID=6337 RepID=A0A0V1FRY5_TRIPS|nr:hypothetical protein T4D_5681 [Trichinella pseudospiralis]